MGRAKRERIVLEVPRHPGAGRFLQGGHGDGRIVIRLPLERSDRQDSPAGLALHAAPGALEQRVAGLRRVPRDRSFRARDDLGAGGLRLEELAVLARGDPDGVSGNVGAVQLSRIEPARRG